jgi:tetratricopeptide (TPR) repeat protein
MKKAGFILSVVLLAVVSVFAQDFEKRATENPFECALFLISKGEISAYSDFFAQNLVKQGRYDEAIDLIKRGKIFSAENELMIKLGNKLTDDGKPEAADKFLSEALKNLREEDAWDDNYAPLLAAGLIRRNRIAEANEVVLRQEGEADKAAVLTKIAEAYFNLGQRETAENYLNEAFALRDSFDDFDQVLDIIDLSVKYSSPPNAAEFLRLAEESVRSNGDETPSVRTRARLALYYFKINQKAKAFKIWNDFYDEEDADDSLSLTLTLLKNNDTQNALALFNKTRLDADQSVSYGLTLVQIYLRLNDSKAAFRIAQAMSKNVDDYSQQAAFMMIADKFIEEKKANEALPVLDLAFRRAAEVGETHRDQDSIGASPLTRKIQYLRNIRDRYLKLNRFEQALGVLNPLKIRDDHYQYFYSETLIEYVGKQLKTLPRRKIDELLTKATNVFDADEDYRQRFAAMKIAELYAQIGDKPKALEILTGALQRTLEESSNREDFLMLASIVFEKYDLKADANLKKVLGRIIDENDQ